ncbi:MAG: hypothetical protein WCK25_02710 [Actinomycetes bacterium]
MARSNSGNLVSKAAATGGVRRRGSGTSGPSRFQLGMVAIVVVGLLSIVWAKVDYNNRNAKPPADTTKPTIGMTWYAGLETNVCGAIAAPLVTSATNAQNGLTSLGSGVIKIAPVSAIDAGRKATLAQFYTEFGSGKGTDFNANVTPTSLSSGNRVYSNGEACPAGTPQAGKPGKVSISVWSSSAYNLGGKPTLVTTNPRVVRFHDHDFITVSFLPDGVAAEKPSATVYANVNTATSGQPITPTPASTTTIPQ